jgi:hypothetical protein
MLMCERLDDLRNADIRNVDKDALPDMSGFRFDNNLPQDERAKRIYMATKNPYLFRLGDMAVKVEFAENGPPLQEVMTSFLLRQKCGI